MDNTQAGPAGSADLLADVVSRVTYKPGWSIRLAEIAREREHLAGGAGLTLIVNFAAQSSTRPDQVAGLEHFFAVPPAEYDRQTWERWVLDCLLAMEQHEACEFFKVDGWAPYFPPHGDRCGKSPYTIERRAR